MTPKQVWMGPTAALDGPQTIWMGPTAALDGPHNRSGWAPNPVWMGPTAGLDERREEKPHRRLNDG